MTDELGQVIRFCGAADPVADNFLYLYPLCNIYHIRAIGHIIQSKENCTHYSVINSKTWNCCAMYTFNYAFFPQQVVRPNAIFHSYHVQHKRTVSELHSSISARLITTHFAHRNVTLTDIYTVILTISAKSKTRGVESYRQFIRMV